MWQQCTLVKHLDACQQKSASIIAQHICRKLQFAPAIVEWHLIINFIDGDFSIIINFSFLHIPSCTHIDQFQLCTADGQTHDDCVWLWGLWHVMVEVQIAERCAAHCIALLCGSLLGDMQA